MIIFSSAVDTLFNDPNISEAATYYAGLDDGVAVRVIVSTPAQNAGVLTSGLGRIPTRRIDVRKSEIASPCADDDFIVMADGTQYRIRAADLDSQRLVWKLDVDEKAS